MDDFEQFLKRQSPRALPQEWRAEILAAAADARREQCVEAAAQPEVSPTPWWLAWLWPSPMAWAGVACAWVLIVGLDAASRPDGATLAHGSGATYDDLLILAQRQQLFRQFCLRVEEVPQEASEPRRKLWRRDTPGACNGRNPDTQIA